MSYELPVTLLLYAVSQLVPSQITSTPMPLVEIVSHPGSRTCPVCETRVPRAELKVLSPAATTKKPSPSDATFVTSYCPAASDREH